LVVKIVNAISWIRRRMRPSLLFALAVTAAAIVSGTPAKAQNYPWCAQYKGLGGATNCGFVSFEQCLATVSGIGGFCMLNNTYQPSPRLRPSRVQRYNLH